MLTSEVCEMKCTLFSKKKLSISQFKRYLFLDDDALVGHGGDVGAPSRAGSHDYGNLSDALGGHVGLVEEDAAEMISVGEYFGLPVSRKKVTFKEFIFLEFLTICCRRTSAG